MQTALAFQATSFDVIDLQNQPWVRGYQVGTALGYSVPDLAIRKIFDRHSDEFTASMTAVVTLPTPGGPQETRIFSLRGCHLLAMFSRTPVAKAFRVWVLDVLETGKYKPKALPKSKQKTLPKPSPALKALPAPQPTYAEKCGEFIQRLELLRFEAHKLTIDVHTVLVSPFWQQGKGKAPEAHQPFCEAMNYALPGLFLAINKSMDAASRLCTAYIEGERILKV